MFYWIIPYLVAYNVSEPAVWKNGPIHTFAVEVEANVAMESHNPMYTEFTMVFACKPTNAESTISCSVKNATFDNYEITENSTDASRMGSGAIYDPAKTMEDSIDFNIEFDKNGVKNVTFIRSQDFYGDNMILSIIDNLNVGVDPSDKTFGHLIGIDKSINGQCPTSFDIKTIPREDHELTIHENTDVKNMTSTFPEILSDDQTLVIEKDRKMHKCTKKTPYFFGSEEPLNRPVDRKRGFRMELEIVSSRTKMYLGKNRFTSYTEHSGVVQMGIKGEYLKNTERMKIKGKTIMSTKLWLVSIHQAND